MNTSFSCLDLSPWLCRFLPKINYLRPSPIQQKSIPLILHSQPAKAVVVQSATGSGKTACFGLPMVDTLSKDPFGIYGLVLTPSRELALQIQEQLAVYGQSFNLRVANLIGGVSLLDQQKQLDDIPHIIVGTPGRVLQLLSCHPSFQKYIKNLNYLVLDEVDRMLQTNINTDLQEILKSIPVQSKKVLTSATLLQSDLTDSLKHQLQIDSYEFVSMEDEQQKSADGNQVIQKSEDANQINTSITQKYLFIPQQVNEYYLISLIKQYEGTQIIVFFNKCRDAHLTNLICQKMKIESTVLHSLLSQKERFRNLKLFRNKKKCILFTTDISSRGLDIPNVDIVINKELPRSFRDYVHRIGRTGRNNRPGTAISLVTQYDQLILDNIQTKTQNSLILITIDEEKVMKSATDIIKLRKKIEVFMSEKGITKRFDEKKIIK